MSKSVFDCFNKGREGLPLFGLAPMAGYTDKAMRTLCRRFGADVVVTEMVSAKALTYGNKKSLSLLDVGAETGAVAVQLFGSEPEVMAEAANIAVNHGAKWIDINMGCPVPKVVNNGEGSALLKDPLRAVAIVEAMTRAVSVPVSVKMRIGWSRPDLKLPEFGKRLAEAGATALCVHGRTREQYYSGTANWDAIADVVSAVDIPVFANGDVATWQDGLAILEKTNAFGVMVGRGALGEPWLFAQLKAASRQRPIPSTPERLIRAHVIWVHATMAVADKGEWVAMRELRKVLGWYAKGLPGATDFRRAMSGLTSMDDLRKVLKRWHEAFDDRESEKAFENACSQAALHVK